MKIKLPDIGDFTNVDVIEILVKVGQLVNKNDHLISIETDKASIEIPSEYDGEVHSIDVSVGDKVSQGDLIVTMKMQDQNYSLEKKESTKPQSKSTNSNKINTDLLVLGAGPGGYTAAFRAADLGLNVTLVERWPVLGGVCLNVGCIPSKALLHAAKVIDDAAAMGDHGIKFSKPKINPKLLNSWKDSIIKKLTTGLDQLAKQRKVKVIEGEGKFASPNQITVNYNDGAKKIIGFKSAIIAAGSQSSKIPNTPDDERIMDSTGALELKDIPIESLIPKSLDANLSIEDFLIEFSEFDNDFFIKYQKANKENKVLRYIASWDGKNATVGLKSVGKDNPFYNQSGRENFIVFKTKRYHDIPLVIKGHGAGAEVTAAAVLGDIISCKN